MKLKDLLDQLAYGELSQVSIGGYDSGGVLVENYPKIIPHINLALTEIYKRFPISLKEVFIQQYDQIQTYVLDSKYAETNTESNEPIKYIIDSVYQPFLDDVLVIDRVYNEGGEELYINDETRQWSIFLPTYNSIQIPYPHKENNLSVVYRANHKTIQVDGLDPTTEEVDISSTFLEPLLMYIASRVYANMSTNGGNEGNNYLAKYEASCRRIEELGLITTDHLNNENLWRNGWV